jgi:hypothetical protein
MWSQVRILPVPHCVLGQSIQSKKSSGFNLAPPQVGGGIGVPRISWSLGMIPSLKKSVKCYAHVLISYNI